MAAAVRCIEAKKKHGPGPLIRFAPLSRGSGGRAEDCTRPHHRCNLTCFSGRAGWRNRWCRDSFVCVVVQFGGAYVLRNMGITPRTQIYPHVLCRIVPPYTNHPTPRLTEYGMWGELPAHIHHPSISARREKLCRSFERRGTDFFFLFFFSPCPFFLGTCLVGAGGARRNHVRAQHFNKCRELRDRRKWRLLYASGHGSRWWWLERPLAIRPASRPTRYCPWWLVVGERNVSARANTSTSRLSTKDIITCKEMQRCMHALLRIIRSPPDVRATHLGLFLALMLART